MHSSFHKGGFTMEKTHILWASRTEWPAGWQLQEHSHSYFHLFFLRSGNATFLGNNIEYPLIPGDLIIFPPNVPHGFHQKNRGLCLFYEIKFNIFDSDFLEMFEFGAPFQVQQIPQLELMLQRIVSLYNSSRPNIADRLDVLLSALFCLIDNRGFDNIRSNFFDASNYSPVVQKTIKYLESNFAEPYNLSVLSSALDFNRSYLCSQFKKETGVVISTCLHYIRIRRVLALLYYNHAVDDFKINMASQYVGFEDASYFNRIFKNLTGLTPRQFVESVREGYNHPDMPFIQYYNHYFRDANNDTQRNTVLNSIKIMKGLREQLSHHPTSTQE